MQLVGNLDRLYFLRFVCPANEGVQILRIFVAQMFKAGAREQQNLQIYFQFRALLCQMKNGMGFGRSFRFRPVIDQNDA